MPYPETGQPLPRAADAHTTAGQVAGLDPRRPGPRSEWTRVFDVGPDDSEGIWQAIAAAVLDARVSTVRDRTPHGVVCGVEVELTITDRTARVATAWHYADEEASPRLVTAYPRP